MSFDFVDLFAGIGGFHAALSTLGGSCVLASEIEPNSSRIYVDNWMPLESLGLSARFVSDVRVLGERPAKVPSHSLLAAGFPCQPFSKSGHQRGIEETRGTLFWDILKILEAKRPTVVFLENVRNLAGPRHRETWQIIIHQLRELGYKTSDEPCVMSPHLLPPKLGGSPQVRDRVFILAHYVGKRAALRDVDIKPIVTRGPVDGWDPASWDAIRDLPAEEPTSVDAIAARLSAEDEQVLHMWDHFVKSLRLSGGRLPGFPLWTEWFVSRPRIPEEVPGWKQEIIWKNVTFYRQHKFVIDEWRRAWPMLKKLSNSRRKFEWQGRDAASVWDCAIQFRPSGVRCKQPTYLPALVAMNQTSVLGPLRRRITVREAARLQGFPESFVFGQQMPRLSFRQLGNAVPPRLAYWLLRSYVEQHAEEIRRRAPELVDACALTPLAMPVEPPAAPDVAALAV